MHDGLTPLSPPMNHSLFIFTLVVVVPGVSGAVTTELTPPVIETPVEAVYPERAKAEHVEGRVLLKLTLDAEGAVTDVELLESAGHGFDESAITAARQLRFVPAREDLATPASWCSPISTRAAIEAMAEGDIAVAGAMGVTDAGIFGDILCARMAVRKVGALITDGVMRDMDGVLATGLPVWCAGAAAPASVAGLTFVNWNEPVGCGGVAVFPGDIISADGDGAVVIPKAMLAEVAEQAVEQERHEGWVIEEVRKGVPLPGLYPANAENRARYEAWRKNQDR